MQATILQPRKRNDRLSRLWDDLLSDPVAPHPVAKRRTIVEAHSEARYASARPLAPSRLSLPEKESPATAWSFATLEEAPAGTFALQEEERIDPLLLTHDEPDALTTTDEMETGSSPWRESLEKLLHDLAEPVPAEAESETTAAMSMEAAHEESLSFSSPFRWEPRPAWVQPPVQSNSQYVNRTNPHYFVSRPNIPIRPLHKQPFFKRLFFYLRRWLSRSSRKAR